MAEWFKAAVLKTARGFTLPRGFESHPFRQINNAKRYNYTILFGVEPGAPGSRPTGQGEAGRLPGPPRSPAVLKITPYWDELTPPRRGFSFLAWPASCERDRAGRAPSLWANRSFARNEPAMQKPIATLAIGGLMNATLLRPGRRSKDAAAVSYTGERAARGSRSCRASATQ